MTETEPTKTFTQIANERWQQICKIWGSSQIGYAVLLVIIGVLIGRFVLFPADEGYNTNIYTEVLSVALTIFVLDRFAERRERDSYKRRLLREVRSQTPAVSVAALEALDAEGWWGDFRASLQGNLVRRYQWEKVDLREKALSNSNLALANLTDANLVGVNLSDCILLRSSLANANMLGAKLENSILIEADLSDAQMITGQLHGATLNDSNLSETILTASKFQSARLVRADFSDAVLIYCNLSEAILDGAILYGSNLQQAQLQGVSMVGTRFDKNTILPDGTFWTPETDMQRFTDPEHPEFWSPE